MMWQHNNVQNLQAEAILFKEIQCKKRNWIIFEPVHEISNNVVCATGKASDQSAHTRSLIRAFASRLIILWMLSYWQNTIWSF